MGGVARCPLHDEVLDVEKIADLVQAGFLAEEWRAAHNNEHPHAASSMMALSDQLAANRTNDGSVNPKTDEQGPVT